MKIDDVRAMSTDELREQMRNLKKEAFNMRFQKASGQLETPHACVGSGVISRKSKQCSANSAAPFPPPASEETMPRRVLIGRVVSDKSDKTVVVTVNRRVMHPLYKKFITRTKKFTAHDAENTCRIGDQVRIQECRPLSRRKTWEVIERISQAATS